MGLQYFVLNHHKVTYLSQVWRAKFIDIKQTAAHSTPSNEVACMWTRLADHPTLFPTAVSCGGTLYTCSWWRDKSWETHQDSVHTYSMYITARNYSCGLCRRHECAQRGSTTVLCHSAASPCGWWQSPRWRQTILYSPLKQNSFVYYCNSLKGHITFEFAAWYSEFTDFTSCLFVFVLCFVSF